MICNLICGLYHFQAYHYPLEDWIKDWLELRELKKVLKGMEDIGA